MRVFLLYLGLMSLAAFIVYGTDKSRAGWRHRRSRVNRRSRARRVPERVLLTLAFAGGALGAAAGMAFFHHKTRKTKFRVLVPLAVVMWVAVIAALLFLSKTRS